MPELDREALGGALALACLSKPDTTFGGNNFCAGQPGGGLMLANHEKSSHSGLLADKDHPLLRGARAGQIVAMSVCGRCAEAAMRPFRNVPKSAEFLINVPKHVIARGSRANVTEAPMSRAL